MTSRDDHRRPPGFRPSPTEDPAAADDTTVLEGDADRRVVLEAAPDDVWRALTDPDELDAWWGEGSTLDPIPGGEGRFVDDDGVRAARVVEARPGQRLVLDWWPEDPADDTPASRVTIELVPCPFGTVLTVTERRLLDVSELPTLVVPRPTFLPFRPGFGPRARALVLA